MKTAKLGALFLISVLALAGTGASYALWSDTLYINGTVNTGYIGAIWSIEKCYDDEIPEKDVSCVTATIIEDTMTIIVNNAYPCITYTVEFDVTNTGTIPLHFYFDWTSPADFPGTIIMTGLPPAQLHEGDIAYGTITIHLDNDAEQSTTYTFSATLVYYQYNEIYPPI